jgi:hypothetical protein
VPGRRKNCKIHVTWPTLLKPRVKGTLLTFVLQKIVTLREELRGVKTKYTVISEGDRTMKVLCAF